MTDDVKIAFEPRIRLLALNELLPSRTLPPGVKESAKYRRIAASVARLGLIEPLTVARPKGDGPYLLLDGHVRRAIMLDQGSSQARCLVARDDEAFTYNKRISRLAVIQEHFMIVRALERGVSEEKLAAALDVDVKAIRRRRHLLAGITPEVAEHLKERPIGHYAFKALRRMKPIRQLEVAELMVSANNYSFNYARALLATTKPADLVHPESLKKDTGLSADQMARLEREMASVSEDYKELEVSYGDDMLLLVIAAGYLERLISRPDIERFLATRHVEILENFRGIVAAASLDQPNAAAA